MAGSAGFPAGARTSGCGGSSSSSTSGSGLDTGGAGDGGGEVEAGGGGGEGGGPAGGGSENLMNRFRGDPRFQFEARYSPLSGAASK
jgi:hypothetical protein